MSQDKKEIKKVVKGLTWALEKARTQKYSLSPVVKAICEMVSRSEFVNSLKELDVLCPDLDGAETLEKDKPSCSFTPETKQKASEEEEDVTSPAPASKNFLSKCIGTLFESQQITDMEFIVSDRQQFPMTSSSSENDEGTDATETIKAHRVVVAARCDWFKRALQSGMKESIDRKFFIEDCSPSLFKDFLRYLYTGVLDVKGMTVENLTDLMSLADRYEVDDLKYACEKALIKQVDISTALCLFSLADNLSAGRLKNLDLAVGIENTPIRLNPVEFPTVDESIVKELNAAESILQKIFGYPKFRQGQKEIIKNISEKHDVIALLPTGGGKTVIYVIAGMILSGITFVVQPIKSLMEEQVRSLREKGVTSFFINSYCTDQEVIQIVSALRSPSIRYAIVFISPEKIISKTVQDLLQTLSNQNRLNLFAVDEAQCVDLWGGSFRESYKDLGFLKSFNVPIVALSGSATDRTISVIRDRLGLVDPVVKRTSFARTNLNIKIVKKTDKPVAQIVQIVENHYPGQCGIIYCSKRPSTKDIAYALKPKGISATHVDGKLKDLEKRRNENLWKKNQASVICATKCFGMGIDKGGVRFLLHFEMPDSIENYYQQIGRGGRHGDDADCILLFSVKDKSFHIQSIMSKKDREEIEYRQQNLNSMTNFCMQLQSCRHVVILNHFREDCEPCGQKCDICMSGLKEIDRTEEAKIIVNCFVRMRAESAEVTVDLLCPTLLGSKSQALKTKKFDENQYFGTGKTFQGCKGRDAKVIIQTLIYKLIFSNVLIERCKTQTLNQRRAAEARTVASLYLDTGELGPLYEGKIQIMS